MLNFGYYQNNDQEMTEFQKAFRKSKTVLFAN